MARSWKAVPQGADPQVDTMRQRLQNLIDLQRPLTANYTQLAEIYYGNEGNAQFHVDQQTGRMGDVVGYKSALRQIVFGAVGASVMARQAALDQGRSPKPTLARRRNRIL